MRQVAQVCFRYALHQEPSHMHNPSTRKIVHLDVTDKPSQITEAGKQTKLAQST